MKLLTLSRLQLPEYSLILALLTVLAIVSSCETSESGPASQVRECTGLNVNTASMLELASLPGIGPSTAAKIVRHRELFGSFRKAEHLMLVDGISRKRYKALKGAIHTC